MKDFQDRIAVITGGASGIGLGIARALASRGMKLVIADLNQQTIDAAVSEFSASGVEAIGVLCDVSKLEQVQNLADKTMETYGAVHVLCNNAGVGIPTSAREIKLEDWKWIIDVDLWGPIYGVKIFAPLIEAQGEGHISATSSMAGLISANKMGAYSVAKHGVVALMTALERELRSKKSPVTASVLCPGPINTNISRNSVSYRPPKPETTTSTGSTEKKSSGKGGASIQAILEEGMAPDDVGELVAAAIEGDKFWILTHPWWTKGVQRQLDALREDQTLTKH
ncbi:MAG: NAD(P)-dependent dehydrogenase (short-subunit alcohol dehydrogenase family) [Flavobacterium sp.]|jgi:NAD(P)-dependent dehydrogenase (short-subunit alcohol dehydrogenase family)